MNKPASLTRYAGIYDATTISLAVSPAEEVQYQAEVEYLLPGQWSAFRDGCIEARSLKQAYDLNRTGDIKKAIDRINTFTTNLSEKFEELPPAAVPLFPTDTLGIINELKARCELAKSKYNELDSGKPSLLYRVWLAKKIAILMIDAGENPSLLRDISCDSWQGNHTYAKLFRIALIFVDGKDPGDFFSYLRQGLDQALNI